MNTRGDGRAPHRGFAPVLGRAPKQWTDARGKGLIMSPVRIPIPPATSSLRASIPVRIFLVAPELELPREVHFNRHCFKMQ